MEKKCLNCGLDADYQVRIEEQDGVTVGWGGDAMLECPCGAKLFLCESCFDNAVFTIARGPDICVDPIEDVDDSTSTKIWIKEV